jgi:hypothetical protein
VRRSAGREDRHRRPGRGGDREALEALLVRAAKFEEMFDNDKVFETWRPWRIPKSFTRLHPSENYSLEIPPDTDFIKARLMDYHPQAIR